MLMPLIGAGVAVLVLGSVRAMINEPTHGGPALGNLIDFPASVGQGGRTSPTLVVTRADGSTCVLDIPTIRESGGSFVVTERQLAERLTIRLLWAGQRTTADPEDCGRSAELLMTKRQVTALLYAARGYGPAAPRSPGS
ncbi:MAG: hypothetical protein AB7O80_26860 [Acetobacteraceae bacterium]